MYSNPTIFGVEIIWYSTFHYLGLFCSLLFGIYYYKKHGKNTLSKKNAFFLVSSTIFLMLFGARIMGMCEAYIAFGEWPSLDIIFQPPSKGKFRWSGSVLALFLFIPIIGKILKIKNYKNYMDVLAISLCILTAITKQGCQFSGDGCYGIATTLPWGMYYPYGAAPNLLPVHPTPIYDSIFHIFLFIILIYLDKRKTNPGNTALLYFLCTSIFYISLEMIRLNPKTSLNLTIPQLNFIFIGIITSFILLNKKALNTSKKRQQ